MKPEDTGKLAADPAYAQRSWTNTHLYFAIK